MVYFAIGLQVYWSFGLLVCWSIFLLVCWSIFPLVYWSIYIYICLFEVKLKCHSTNWKFLSCNFQQIKCMAKKTTLCQAVCLPWIRSTGTSPICMVILFVVTSIISTAGPDDGTMLKIKNSIISTVYSPHTYLYMHSFPSQTYPFLSLGRTRSNFKLCMQITTSIVHI